MKHDGICSSVLHLCFICASSVSYLWPVCGPSVAYHSPMISRRSFLSLAGASALARPALAWRHTSQVAPAIDAARLRRRLEVLSTHGRPAGGTFASGVSRVAYSVADITARAWLLEEIKEAGLAPRIDAAGNIYARWGGVAARPPILFGSHIDSVPSGGNFDGDLGVMASLGALEAVKAANGRRAIRWRW